MAALPHFFNRRQRGAALIIVLAFVVLLTGLMVAYLSRTTSDRQVAHSSFNQSKADQAAASGMDLVIGGLRQEITGPNPTPTPPYVPATNANMLPLRSGNPGGVPDPIPNLVRRSVYPDTIPAPGISSLASAVNSTTNASANGRSISLGRWNKHYLIPKANISNDTTDPIASFTAPDWVILTRGPRTGTTTYPVAFSTWEAALADQTSTNNLYAIGRYAYAIYDEGGLLDANVAGYPTGTTADQAGRKGPVAFADLTALPSPSPNPPSPYFPNSSSPYQIDNLVGWRNYGSTQPTNNFPGTTFAANFRAGSGPALAYWTSIINNTTGFLSASGAVAANGRTNQMFLSRQQLIAFQKATGFPANALEYLTTFSRELNAPTWKPSTPTGSTFDYAFQANTPTASTSTAINRDLLGVRVGSSFTRADGTTTAVGDLLMKQRFPLSRINGLGPTGPNTTVKSTIANGFLVPASTLVPDPNGQNITTVQRDFGLVWNTDHWDYVGAFKGSPVQSAIERLDQVAGVPGVLAGEKREPNFFELLKAGILSGSVGIGSGGTNTFVAAEAKYLNSDYQIMQIGANIINQWNFNNNVPIFINFNGNQIAGIKNLPYLNKLVFKPAWTVIPGTGKTPVPTYKFDAWLLPSLWNPHQQDANALNPRPAPQNVRIAMTSGTFTATLNPSSGTVSSITGDPTPTQFMTVDASGFGTSPSAPLALVKPPNPPSTVTQSPDVTVPAGGYWGFHVALGTATTTAPSSSSTAAPNFGAGCTFELQVQVSTSPVVWKTYQKWTGCAQPATPLACAPSSWLNGSGNTATGVANLQDPEFVTLDPRTLRFGVWGNAAKQSLVPADYTTGVLSTLETPAGVYEAITALPPQPQGTNFIYTGPPYALYNYANNLTTSIVYYTDLDTLRRQGDIISGTTTAMLPALTDPSDRPQILNRPFQSMAELGQVFRDQPWKTLDFFMTTASPDAGLLDIFSLHEASMEAGKTSLNTRQKPVLTAILSQATKRLIDPTGATVITSAQRDAIVNALYNITSTQPMIRKTDLLTQLAADSSVTALGSKQARDLVIRAFSDAGQTRTWNLLIDVVAQSGRYPSNASTLAGFLVEGEQHFWVHVAIDRLTGQVIDKQIEVVNE
jgi:hypothetical protein